MKNLLSTRIYLLGLLAVMAVFASCDSEDSADVNQERIYADYEVFYNSNKDETLALARFRFGNALGTSLELTGDAEVTFDGDGLAYNKLYAGHSRVYAGRKETGTFVYTNAEGKKFTNSIPNYKTIGFPSDVNTMTKSESYDLVWVGDALGPNESVSLFIGNWEWGKDAFFIETRDGANNFVINKQRLSGLALGSSTLFMDRSLETALSEGTEAGGRIRGKFRATNKAVTISE